MKNMMLMQAIGNIDDEYVEEVDPDQSFTCVPVAVRKTMHVWKFASIAACLAVIVSLIVFANNRWFNMPNGNPNNLVILPSQTEGQSPDNSSTQNVSNPGNTSKADVENPMTIVINRLSDTPKASDGDIGLNWDDVITMTAEQLQDYFGTQIYPLVLPPEFLNDFIVDDSWYGRFFVFENNNGEIYYDQNDILYESKKAAEFHEQNGYRDYSLPSILITVSKERAIFNDARISVLYESELEISNINGNEVTISAYTDKYGENFFAYFVKDGVNFEVYGNLILQDDFIDMLVSYFE